MSRLTTAILMDVRLLLRERLMIALVLSFLVVAVASGLIGWSTSHTLQGAYSYSIALLQPGAPVPANPANGISHLSLLANLSIYLFLVGSLLAIVFGYAIGRRDQATGMLPLILSRNPSSLWYVIQKSATLAITLLGLMILAGLTLTAMTTAIPGLALSLHEIVRLYLFLLTSWLYLTIFAITALLTSLMQPSSTKALIFPVLLWIIVGFVLPQSISHVEPVGLLNPAALADQAAASTSNIIGLLSLGEQYSLFGLGMLDYRGVQIVSTQLASLALFAVAALAAISIVGSRWLPGESRE